MDVEFIVIETLDTGGHLRVGHYIVSEDDYKSEYALRMAKESTAVLTGSIQAFSLILLADPHIDRENYRGGIQKVNA